jgi:UDP-2,4-diacetamido-2,4,6-trideoxy-beta-L-altropyranose hydrolase
VTATTAAIALKPATAADCRQVWLWRNDAETRRASFDSSEITLETHERWFLDSLRNSGRRIYIVLAESQPVGVVRLDLREGLATVSIHLAPQRQGQGLGPAALLALDAPAWTELDLDGLVAVVKPDNYPSISAFRKAGFRLASSTVPAIVLVKPRPRGGS